MSWERLATGIDAQWTADSGSGGLVELVSGGLFHVQAEDGDKPPFAVFSLVADEPSDFFSASVEATEYTWDITVYLPTSGATPEDLKRDVAERLKAVYHRQAPTVDGGFTASQHFFEGTAQNGRIDDTLVLTQAYRTTLTK